ncbi:MAG: hypothetical protein IJ740_06640 [Ruminococcus sp.]|nr:hypothetical protein [Ruminococcus sp.]
MKKRFLSAILSIATAFTLCQALPLSGGVMSAAADEYYYDEYANLKEYFKFTNLDENGVLNTNTNNYNSKEKMYYSYCRLDFQFSSKKDCQYTATIADTSVLKFDYGDDKTTTLYYMAGKDNTGSLSFYTQKPGKTTITVKDSKNNVKYTVPVIVNETNVEITSTKATLAGNAKLKWKPVSGVDGYVIYKGDCSGEYEDAKSWKVAKFVSGQSTSSAIVDSYWGEKAGYRVGTYIDYNGKKIYTDIMGIDPFNTFYTTPKDGAKISSVKKSGKSSLKVTWKNVSSKVSYKLYRSESENYGYKLIKTIKKSSKKTLSYTDKVSKGKVYYYRLVTVKDKYKSGSASVSGMVSVSGKKKEVKTGKKLNGECSVGIYEQGGKLKEVFFNNNYDKNRNELIIRTYNKNLKVTNTKKVTLNSFKYDELDFGGFYHSDKDDSNYVVVGRDNYKESKKKVVIKVIKYSKNWKKQKVTSIKANQSYSFDGIVQPFRSGNVDIAESGNRLFVYTSRLMYVHSDGFNHQSNIAFEINTKTMKLRKNPYNNYVSHSFQQFARYKDNDLYLADRGDAYPRAIQITAVDSHDTAKAGDYDTLFRELPFKFKGETGDNATGGNIGGMEVGKDNIITIGAAQPHYKKVKGVSGFKGNYNLYVIATDRKTGKSTFKWLTEYHPTKSKYGVGMTRLVKVTDDCFAIFYKVEKDYQNSKTYCIYIDNKGNVIKKRKSYGNMEFGNDMTVYNGNIVFSSEYITTKSIPKTYKTPWGTQTYRYEEETSRLKMIKIPAYVK